MMTMTFLESIVFLLQLHFAIGQLPLLIQSGTLHSNYVGDPEAHLDVPAIIRKWGYPFELHQTVTPDGYILAMHRIPHGKDENVTSTGQARKPVVFLQHGLICSSSVWVTNLPHQSPGFIFADQGFDVWMGNMRGNIYSKRHIYLEQSSPQFWRFSFDQMASQDLPTMINTVLNITGQPHLYYIGHSQGALTMLSKLASDATFGKKIRKFFAIAPVATMGHVKGMARYVADQMYEQMQLILAFYGDTEFLPNNLFTKLTTEFVCGLASQDPMCENVFFLLSGPDSQQMNKSRIGVYMAHNPSGTSLRNIIHFAQLVRARQHRAYDYGNDYDNMRYYGTPHPPTYDIRRIRVPTYLFYSAEDWMATATDIEQYIIPNLPVETLKMKRKLSPYNHNDFLWGNKAPAEIYHPIAAIIKMDQREPQNEPLATTTKVPKNALELGWNGFLKHKAPVDLNNDDTIQEGSGEGFIQEKSQ